MPAFSELGQVRGPRLFASLVRCDGADGRVQEEAVASDRIWFVLAGRFALRGSGGRGAADPATALRLRRGEPYCIRHPDGCGDLCLSVGGALIEEAMEQGGMFAPLRLPAFVALRSIARRLEAHEPVEAAELEEVACAALDDAPPAIRATSRERRLADAVAFELALRFDERLSLATLAAPHGVSAFTLCRAFRRARGVSIHRSLQRLRVRHALGLVLGTEWTLARIAAECGFASHAHLTTLFRREQGTTPSAARQRARNSQSEAIANSGTTAR